MVKQTDAEKLSGIIPPIVTPFDEQGNVQYELFKEAVMKMVRSGVHGVTVGGSTGEGSTLSEEELENLCKIAIDEVPSGFPVIAGIITDSTVQALRKAKRVKELGVDALMITPIHYLFSDGDRGNYNFYKEIKETIGLPIIVYNVVPWNVVSVETLIKLAKEKVIDGIKQSNGDIHALISLKAELGDSVPIFNAIDDVLYPSFVLGVSGAIAAINTILPKASVKIYEAVKKGDHATALKLHNLMLPVVRAYYLKPNMPAYVKWLMNNSGWNVGLPRRPIMPLEKEEGKRLESVIKRIVELEGEAK